MTWIKEFIYEFYLDRFDPTLEQSQLALKSLIALCIAITLASTYEHQHALWLILPTILLMQTYRGKTKQQRLFTLFSCSLILIITIFSMSLIGNHTLYFMMTGFMLACACYYVTNRGPDIMVPALMILIASFIAGSKNTSLDVALVRLEYTGFAAIIAIICSLCIWPYHPRRLIDRRIKLSAKHLKDFSKWVLLDHVCGMPTSAYGNELRVRCFNNLQQLRQLLNHYPDSEQIKRWRLLLRFYGSIVAIAHLLDEPLMPQSFNIITPELKRIQTLLYHAFEDLNNHDKPQPAKSISLLAQELSQNNINNEDLVSLAFLLSRMATQIKDYHAISA